LTRPPAGLALSRTCSAPLSAFELPWLIGFLEAEGHFGVGRNNRGRTWRCFVQVAVRDDDADLLLALHRRTQLGTISAVAAHRTSQPQLAWKITAKHDCLVVADWLSRHPARARKRRETTLWVEAVELWASERYLLAKPLYDRIARCANELQAIRRYVEAPSRPADPVAEPDLIPYLGGFFTGEGWFGVQPRGARVGIRLRADDLPLLDEFRHAFGIGSIYRSGAHGRSKPAAMWVVHARRHLAAAVELLDAAGLRGRKLRQYAAWRPAALELADAAAVGRALDPAILAEARRRLAAAGRYVPNGVVLPSARDHRDAARAAYIELLRTWASKRDGGLSCSAYERARQAQPHWPNRNTITRAFGSWRAALTAAGLGARAIR
jgi:hypothetical protein